MSFGTFKLALIVFITAVAQSGLAFKQVSNNLTLERPTVDRNYLSLELGGRGVVYSLNYDRRISQFSNIGFGFSHYSVSANPTIAESKIDLNIIPVYTNIYFTRGKLLPYATLGVSLVDLSAQADVNLGQLISGLTLKYQQSPTSDPTTLTTESNLKSENRVHLFLPLPSLGAGVEYRNSGTLFRAQALAIYIDKVYPWFGLSIGGGF